MTLSVPDSDDLLVHMQRTTPFSTVEGDWVDDAMQRATDLMQIATGVDEDPTDELALRILKVGILAQAHAIFVTGGADREAMYSPFSSERLGSYSYSKAVQAVQANLPTGIPEFDMAVSYFGSLADVDGKTTAFQVDAEQVFRQPYPGDPPERSVALTVNALAPFPVDP